MTVCGVDHEYVDPGREQRFGLASDVTTDSDRGPDAQPARRVAGFVQRAAQRTVAGEEPAQPTSRVHHRCEPMPTLVQPSERLMPGDVSGSVSSSTDMTCPSVDRPRQSGSVTTPNGPSSSSRTTTAP